MLRYIQTYSEERGVAKLFERFPTKDALEKG